MIEDLGADHEDLLARSASVRALIDAGDRPAARPALDRLVEILRHHTEIEEASIFTALRDAGELLDDVDALAGEHRAVWTMVDRLELLDDAAWDDVVLAMLDDLHDHIAREEYDLFPATLLAIGPGQWDAVEAAAREARAVAG